MSTTGRIAPGGIFQDPDFDFSARIALGMASSGVSDVGLVLATLGRALTHLRMVDWLEDQLSQRG